MTLSPTSAPSSNNLSTNQNLASTTARESLTKAEPITYTFNDINVWTGAVPSDNGKEVDIEGGGGFNCFNRKKNGVVSKQILNNG